MIKSILLNGCNFELRQILVNLRLNQILTAFEMRSHAFVFHFFVPQVATTDRIHRESNDRMKQESWRKIKVCAIRYILLSTHTSVSLRTRSRHCLIGGIKKYIKNFEDESRLATYFTCAQAIPSIVGTLNIITPTIERTNVVFVFFLHSFFLLFSLCLNISTLCSASDVSTQLQCGADEKPNNNKISNENIHFSFIRIK